MCRVQLSREAIKQQEKSGAYENLEEANRRDRTQTKYPCGEGHDEVIPGSHRDLGGVLKVAACKAHDFRVVKYFIHEEALVSQYPKDASKYDGYRKDDEGEQTVVFHDRYIVSWGRFRCNHLSFGPYGMITGMHILQSCYRRRFSQREYPIRASLWQVLWDEVFRHWVSPGDTVMDIGAGYGEFLRVARAKHKIAVDINPDTGKHAGKGITVLAVSAERIPKIYNGTIDTIFMSNFLEHLPTKDACMAVLGRSWELLRPGGTLIIMQPNIDLTRERYWDFIDHTIALNDRSVLEALGVCGFRVVRSVRRFLPYTTKSWLPMYPSLLRLYLRIPSGIRPFAGQSLFIAIKG